MNSQATVSGCDRLDALVVAVLASVVGGAVGALTILGVWYWIQIVEDTYREWWAGR